jgi:hypothetical protein
VDGVEGDKEDLLAAALRFGSVDGDLLWTVADGIGVFPCEEEECGADADGVAVDSDSNVKLSGCAE